MATKTVTCVASGLKFEDAIGVQHTVTTSQTFTFELTDGGASAVTYQQNNGTSVTTTDGGTLVFRPQSTNTSGTSVGTILTWGPTADAQDGVAVVGLAGEFATSFNDGSGILQMWKAESLTVDNVDAPTLISGRWKDQFGHFMQWTGLTVA